MKRKRTMLLCVTATSMVTVMGCHHGHPVGMVASPHGPVETAANPDAQAESPPTAQLPDDPNGVTVGTTAHVPDKKK